MVAWVGLQPAEPNFVGLTQLGPRINAALAVPIQGRLDSIIKLIEQSEYSVHDLSCIESSRGVPRFNMPVELGLALYRTRSANGKHQVFIFESKRFRTQRSTSLSSRRQSFRT